MFQISAVPKAALGAWYRGLFTRRLNFIAHRLCLAIWYKLDAGLKACFGESPAPALNFDLLWVEVSRFTIT